MDWEKRARQLMWPGVQDGYTDKIVSKAIADALQLGNEMANAAREKWQKSEREISAAYVRLRKLIPGAFTGAYDPIPGDIFAHTETALRKLLVAPDARAEEIAKAIEGRVVDDAVMPYQSGMLEAAAIARSFISKPEPKTREQVLEEALREIAERCTFAGAPDGAMPWTIARRALAWKP